MPFSGASLTTRLWIMAGGIVGFLVASLAGYQYATTMTGDAFEELLRTEVAMDGYVSAARASMLECHHAEEDFLLSRDPRYVARFDEELAQLIARCKSIRDVAHAAGYGGMSKQAGSGITCASRYGEAFHRLVSLSRERGLEHDLGLLGHLRDVINGLADAMAQHELDATNHALAVLRECEEDCLRQPSLEGSQTW